MKIAAAIPLLLLSAAFFQQCIGIEKKEVNDIILSIPEADRFVYESGDLLLYSCTCGSTDTVEIKEVRFRTETSTEKDWFGIEYTYFIDRQSFILEKNDDEWINAVYYAYPSDLDDSYKDPCFIIQTLLNWGDEGLPGTMIVNGCTYPGAITFALSNVTFPIKSINDSIYQNVYSWSSSRSDTAMVEILWNLKYGVIRFSEYISGYWKHWNLEGIIQE